MSLVKIHSEPGLMKDTVTKAVINTDITGFNNYISQRAQMEANKQKMWDYEKQIRSLTNEVGEIKDLLINILNRVK